MPTSTTRKPNNTTQNDKKNMKHSPIRLLQTILISMTLVGAHGTAHAQCTLPNGTAGEQFYNTTHNVMQYCDGTKWVSMGGGGGAGFGASCCATVEDGPLQSVSQMS